MLSFSAPRLSQQQLMRQNVVREIVVVLVPDGNVHVRRVVEAAIVHVYWEEKRIVRAVEGGEPLP